MTIERKSLRFGHHALATLGAATAGATIFSTIFLIMILLEGGGRLPGLSWLVVVTLACWFGVFIVALPAAGLVFSLLWPVTRRQTPAAGLICVIAGVAIGAVLAPLGSPRHHGASLMQLAVFSAIGALVAVAYLIIGNRFSKDTASSINPGFDTVFQ
jgi:hypothetical protein